MRRSVNLGCGPVFVDSPDWLNLDFGPSSPSVKKANLLGRLPLKDGSVGLVYSSHFLEHVPRSSVPAILAECYRVLKPGGVIRLVLPDLENIAREYLSMRDSGDHQKADFVVLELIDQCVRMTPGGELGTFYHSLRDNESYADEMIDYVRQRVGEDLRAAPTRNSGGGGVATQIAKASSHSSNTSPAVLHSGAYHAVAGSLPRSERQPCRRGRAAPLGLGFPPAAASAV